MRILKSVFVCVFLFSLVLVAASGVSRPQGVSRRSYIEVQSALEIGSGNVLGTTHKKSGSSRQEIEGRRVPVDVTYRSKGDQEVGFNTGKHDSRHPLAIDLGLRWNTFLGGTDNDEGRGIAVDIVGNVYVTGTSNATWGLPVYPYSHYTSFVAKLDTYGNLQWNTFLGAYSNSYGIAVDTIGNVYVTGGSWATWGSPIRPYSGDVDVFVAKLDTNGNLLWNTFLGGLGTDWGNGIAVDTIGNVHVTGQSYDTWGSPIHPFNSSNADAFIAKLDSNGALRWNTFLGGADWDEGRGLALDASANVYVTGGSSGTWGSPIRHYTGADAFVAKLDTYGNLWWNTFLGGKSLDEGCGLAVDASANVYVTGESYATWGSPIHPYSGGGDAYVAKLDPYGTLQWNIFLGGADWDEGRGLAVDASANVYVTGMSWASWDLPVRPYSGGADAFVAELDPYGKLLWNAFLGGADTDLANGIAVDTIGNNYVTGWSHGAWGSPIRPISRIPDGFVAKVNAGNLTIASGPHGTTDPAPGRYFYTEGSSVSVSAIADSGYVFNRWMGDVPAGQETSATVSILMDATKSIRANFKAVYGLTISSGPHGTTNPAPGRYLHKEGSIASVSAIADSGYIFNRWTGDVPAGQETSATVSILMDAPKSIQANFKKLYSLTIASGPHGTTNPAPGRYLHKEGSIASVSAIADSECVFDRWTGDVPAGQETSATVSILMNADKSIQANFKLVNPPSNLTAVRLTNRSVTQTEYIVDLVWAANPDNAGLSITTYRVYQKSGDSWVKLADISSNALTYRVRNVPKAEQTFGIASVTDGGVESAKTTVVK